MRRVIGVLAAVLTMTSCVGAANAQTSLPTAAPELTRLRHLVLGTWRTTEDHAPSSLMPRGSRGEGTQSFRAGPGGLTIIIDNKSRNASFPFSGHGVIAWDARAKMFKSFWFDATQPVGEVQLGRWQGRDLVFEGVSDYAGKPMHFRIVYTLFKPNSFTFYTESSMVNGAMTRLMTIQFTRFGRS